MIDVINVEKSFGSICALNNLSLHIEDGSIFGLIGSNGAGKSTLLRILAGVYKQDCGTVLINGQSPFENPMTKSQTIFISDYPYFGSNDTIIKLSKYYKSIFPSWSDKKFEELKRVFPVSFDEKIVKMSKGMQRQAAIILGISTMPKCILFDEIFDGLDPVVRELVKRILIDFVSENSASVIIASHNLRELEDVCDHVGLLHKGGTLLEDELESLKLAVTRIQFALNNPSDYHKLIGDKLTVLKYSNQGKMFELTARDEKNTVEAVVSSAKPLFYEVLPITLEELFISEMEVAGYDIDKLIQ